jgi:hypothetical protein
MPKKNQGSVRKTVRSGTEVAASVSVRCGIGRCSLINIRSKELSWSSIIQQLLNTCHVPGTVMSFGKVQRLYRLNECIVTTLGSPCEISDTGPNTDRGAREALLQK